MNATLSFLETEHQELLEEIVNASKQRSESADIFGRVLKIYRKHLDQEKVTVFPLLIYLRDRLRSNSVIEKSTLLEARDRFENFHEEMQMEHTEMSDLLKRILKTELHAQNSKAKSLAERILCHVEMEEEVIYPAAFASGDLIEWERELLGDRINY